MSENALFGALEEALAGRELALDLFQGQQIRRYLALLQRWNTSVNLASLADPRKACERLILEPISAANVIGEPRTLVDVGSGGGSPAVILKVMLPSVELHMVEVRARKAAFLREVVRDLGLRSVCVHQVQVEALDCLADAVTVRAVRLDRAMRTHLGRLCGRSGRVWVFGSDHFPRDGWAPLEEVHSHPLSGGSRAVLREFIVA